MVKHFVEQPLGSSFMVVSMIGFVVSALVIWPESLDWGFTLTIFFAMLFVAAVFNFTHAPGEEHLDIHNTHKHLKDSMAYEQIKKLGRGR